MNRARIGDLLLTIAISSKVLFAQSGASELLTLETTIPMADVRGRIVHLSIERSANQGSLRCGESLCRLPSALGSASSHL